MTEAVFGVEPL